MNVAAQKHQASSDFYGQLSFVGTHTLYPHNFLRITDPGAVAPYYSETKGAFLAPYQVGPGCSLFSIQEGRIDVADTLVRVGFLNTAAANFWLLVFTAAGAFQTIDLNGATRNLVGLAPVANRIYRITFVLQNMQAVLMLTDLTTNISIADRWTLGAPTAVARYAQLTTIPATLRNFDIRHPTFSAVGP